MFTEQLPDLLDYIFILPGFVYLVGVMNIHVDNPLHSLTKQILTILSPYCLVLVISMHTHMCGHIIDWIDLRPEDDIHEKSTVTESLESDHYCIKSFFHVSTNYTTVRNMANTDRLSYTAELSNVSVFHLLKMRFSSVRFREL